MQEDAVLADSPAAGERRAAFTGCLGTLLESAASWLGTPAPPAASAGPTDLLDTAKLSALRAAVAAHRPRQARASLAESAAGLTRRYGTATAQAMHEALDRLDFDEVLKILDDGPREGAESLSKKRE